MFIISLLFYLLDGIMDSSFLTTLHLALSLCSIFVFIKQLRLFGMPNDSFKVMSHLSSGSFMIYFILLSLYDLGVINAWEWHRFHVIPLVTWAASVLVQLIMLFGGKNYQLHKTLTRIPMLLALIVMAWGNHLANQITLVLSLLTLLLLLIMKTHRQQRRTLFKMYLFFLSSVMISYWSLLVGEFLLLAVLFYFSIFQNAFCIQNLLRQKEANA